MMTVGGFSEQSA